MRVFAASGDVEQIECQDAQVTGVLVLAATPLGDPTDASERLRELIAKADVIAAEDTRRFKRLAADLGVSVGGRVVSFYESVEKARIPALLTELEGGSTVVLLTDAGMPTVSDPGYRLVDACIEAGIAVTAAPGPSAATTALALSGLPSDRFCFEGFLPRKDGERRRRLEQLRAEPRTMIFFEAPHRLPATLSALGAVFGFDRPAAACREMTKTYEEIRRGSLAELIEWAQDGVRGEVTLVVGGAPEVAFDGGPVELARLVAERIAAGADKKIATAEVARELGVPKRTVYEAVLEHG